MPPFTRSHGPAPPRYALPVVLNNARRARPTRFYTVVRGNETILLTKRGKGKTRNDRGIVVGTATHLFNALPLAEGIAKIEAVEEKDLGERIGFSGRATTSIWRPDPRFKRMGMKFEAKKCSCCGEPAILHLHGFVTAGPLRRGDFLEYRRYNRLEYFGNAYLNGVGRCVECRAASVDHLLDRAKIIVDRRAAKYGPHTTVEAIELLCADILADCAYEFTTSCSGILTAVDWAIFLHALVNPTGMAFNDIHFRRAFRNFKGLSTDRFDARVIPGLVANDGTDGGWQAVADPDNLDYKSSTAAGPDPTHQAAWRADVRSANCYSHCKAHLHSSDKLAIVKTLGFAPL